MLTRRSVWSDPRVQELLQAFVPVAEDSERLEPESAFFRSFVSHGHFGAGSGVLAPRGIWQGTYVVAPGGELLGSSPSHEAADVERLLRESLERWGKHPEAQSGAALPASKALAARARAYPADGLALRVFGRDLERWPNGALRTNPGWWNVEFAWYRKEEAAQLVPSPAHVGAQVEVPRAVLARLARFNFVDTVNGFPSGMHWGELPTYQDAEVELARLTSRVEAVEGDLLQLHLEGESRAVTRRIKPERGMALSLLGRATYDTRRQRFTAFELAALGTRHGPTGKGRRDDRAKQPGPTPIGFWVELAPDSPAGRLAPVFLSDYGWK